jgi:hypothetical protein
MAGRKATLSQAHERGIGYWTASVGRRFRYTHQTIATGVLGQTSQVDTTPTFLISQTASSTNTARKVLSAMTLSQSGTPAGGAIHIVIATDQTNRYSSGGTAVVGKNLLNDVDCSGPPALAAQGTFYYNPTASAATSSTRIMEHWVIPVNNVPFSVDFSDELIIGTTGSILIYTWAASTGPTWNFSFTTIQE